MESEENKKTESTKTSVLWSIIIGIFIIAFRIVVEILIAVLQVLFSSDKNSNKDTTIKKKRKQKKKGKMTAYDILLTRGYSEKEASQAIRNCQRDLEMAMDDGMMEELEDIVIEDLGVDSNYVDELI